MWKFTDPLMCHRPHAMTNSGRLSRLENSGESRENEAAIRSIEWRASAPQGISPVLRGGFG